MSLVDKVFELPFERGQLTYLEAKQVLTDAYDRTYGLDTGIAGVFMDPKEMPRSSSLYAARMKEYVDLKIARWYPNFRDYLKLPTYLIDETKEIAKAVLDSEAKDAVAVAAGIKNAINANSQ